MKMVILVCTLALASSHALAENLKGAKKLLCSTSRITACFEDGECLNVLPSEANVPQFIVVDTKKRTLSTTKSSSENRATAISTLLREDGLIIIQGIEQGRAFSYVIDEATGVATASVARDGITVAVFGACTGADLRF